MWPPLLFLFLFLIFGCLLCYQDFKSREISLWLLICYSLTCIFSAYFLQGGYALLANLMSALLYFGLISGVILLYYFFREKKFSNPVDDKIGLGDLVLFLAIGLTLDTIALVLFFSAIFLISALLGLLWFNKREQTVPLGGILTIGYIPFYFFSTVYF